MYVQGKHYRTVWWEDRGLMMIDQLCIPAQFSLVRLNGHQETAQAIKRYGGARRGRHRRGGGIRHGAGDTGGP